MPSLRYTETCLKCSFLCYKTCYCDSRWNRSDDNWALLTFALFIENDTSSYEWNPPVHYEHVLSAQARCHAAFLPGPVPWYTIAPLLPSKLCYKADEIKQEIAANYEKYIRARDPFPWRSIPNSPCYTVESGSIHQNLNSLGNSFCSDSNLTGDSLCRYNFCTWQVWHDTHIPEYRYAVKACAKFVLMTKKWNTTKWNFNHAGNVHYSDVIMSAMACQITGVLIVCLNVCSVADQRKHQSSMSLVFVLGEFTGDTVGGARRIANSIVPSIPDNQDCQQRP